MANPQGWNVQTSGHFGGIDIEFKEVPPGPLVINASPAVPPGFPPEGGPPPPGYQVLFQATHLWPSEAYIVTIENDGPALMKVWLDYVNPNPDGAGVSPAFVLGVKQSATVRVSHHVIVRPAGPPRVKGNYAISWCCAAGVGTHPATHVA